MIFLLVSLSAYDAFTDTLKYKVKNGKLSAHKHT